MKLFILSILSLLSASAMAQTVASSCIAPDSIMEKYRYSADELAIRRIYDIGNSDTASIVVPQSYVDTMMKALVAVHNAVGLPARDSVVYWGMETFPVIDMNNMGMYAEHSMPWMQQLEDSIIPTGNAAIDSLLVPYQFTVSYYSSFQTGYPNARFVEFHTDSNINIAAVITLLDTVQGVYVATTVPSIGDGSNISAEVNTDHIKLTYVYAWGDCPSGCIWSHYWSFKVYYDCSVEFIGSGGDPLWPESVEHIRSNVLSVHPNPFTDQISIASKDHSYKDYCIVSYNGTTVQQGTIKDDKIDTHNVPEGIYMLQLQSKNSIENLKVMKR